MIKMPCQYSLSDTTTTHLNNMLCCDVLKRGAYALLQHALSLYNYASLRYKSFEFYFLLVVVDHRLANTLCANCLHDVNAFEDVAKGCRLSFSGCCSMEPYHPGLKRSWQKNGARWPMRNMV
jgi:hypothetical protein